MMFDTLKRIAIIFELLKLLLFLILTRRYLGSSCSNKPKLKNTNTGGQIWLYNSSYWQTQNILKYLKTLLVVDFETAELVAVWDRLFSRTDMLCGAEHFLMILTGSPFFNLLVLLSTSCWRDENVFFYLPCIFILFFKFLLHLSFTTPKNESQKQNFESWPCTNQRKVCIAIT